MTLAAVYARISSDPNDTALGVKRQIKDCQALAEARGWTVGEVFTDNDVSATRAKPRPAYQQMMSKMTAGAFQALICWDVDRLTRSPRELEDIVDLHERHGVQLASVGGEIDLGTPQGRLTARIKGSVAKHESEQLTRRVKAKMAERAEAGAPHGKVAYGWRREQVYDDTGRRLGSRDVIHPEQADVVRKAAASIAAGDSLRAVTAGLNAAGTLGANGKPWSTTTLRSVLLRCSNAGLRKHQGQIIGKGTWEALIDRDVYDRVVAILSDPTRRTSPASSAIKYLLSGIARCGVCGGPMRVLVVGKDGREQDSYVCQEKYHVRRMREPVEDLVTEIVLERLSQPDARKLLTAGDDTATQALREQAAAVRARLDSAADAYADGTIDGQQLTRITAKLRPDAERLDQLVKAASTAPDLEDIAGPDIRKRWASIPLSRQRAVIQLLLCIEILPMSAGSRRDVFDPTTVRFTWRGTDPPLASSAGPHRV